MSCEHWVCAHSMLESLQSLSCVSAPEMHGGRCTERWQKPDPDNPGQTLAESVMAQFSFRYGVGELWLGVGVTAAWTVVMAGATFLALILLDRETLPPSTKTRFWMQMSAHRQQALTARWTRLG